MLCFSEELDSAFHQSSGADGFIRKNSKSMREPLIVTILLCEIAEHGVPARTNGANDRHSRSLAYVARTV
jgi:hypothetical protein